MGANCEDIRQELSAYYDGEVEASLASEVENHLTDCANCRLEFNKMGGLSKLLSEATNPEAVPVPDLWPAILEKVGDDNHTSAEDLSAYLDDELPPAVKEGIREHLGTCSQCSEQYSRMNATNGLIHQAMELPENVSVDLWPAIKSRLTEDCTLIQGELSAFLDQEVATLNHRQIVAHLTGCPQCKEKFDGLTGVGNAIRDSYKPDISDDFDLWPEIKAKLQIVPFAARPKPQANVIQFKRRKYMVAAAVMALGVAATFMVIPHSNYPQMSAEAYMIDSAFDEPSNDPDLVVYEN